MDLKAVVLVALTVLSSASCDHHITPWTKIIPVGKELVYHYEGLIEAGTHVPHYFTSEFMLKGNMHVQMVSDHEMMVRFDGLTYTLDIGKYGEHPKLAEQTNELTSVTKPFKIVYEHSGIVKEIVVDEHEPEPSLNMKKAMAAMLQMNLEEVVLTSVKPHAFSSEEQSLLGMDKTLYNVIPKGDRLKIWRMHSVGSGKTSTGYLYENVISDAKPVKCEASYEEPITHNSQKMYVIDRKDPAQYVLKHIETSGGVYYQPYKTRAPTYYIYVNQTLHLSEIKDKVAMKMETEHKVANLTYRFVEHCTTFSHIEDPKTLVPEIKTILHTMVDYLKEDHIVPVAPDMKKVQSVNRLLNMLSHLDVGLLEQLYKDLSAKTDENDVMMLHAYEHLIPMIGMKDSLKLVLKLVKEGTVKENVAVEMLEKMSFVVKYPTVELIHDLEELLHLPKAPHTVQKAAILSFATLLYKLHEYDKKHHIADDAIFEKYVKLFLEKVKISEKLEDKYLYLDAMYNMDNHLVLDYLEPLIKGELLGDHKVRNRGILSISNVLIRHNEKAYDLLFPILTDKTLPTYLRISALYYLLQSKPNMLLQMSIGHFVVDERDKDIRNFYYTYYKSLAETTNPCLHKSRMQAKQILVYLPVFFKHSLTQFRRFDMTHWKFDYGQSHNIFFVNTNDTVTFMWKKHLNVMNFAVSPSTFYIKLTGLDHAMLDDFHINTHDDKKFTNIVDVIKKWITSIGKDLHVEIIHMRQGQIVEDIFIDKDNFMTVLPELNIFTTTMKEVFEEKKEIHIDYDMFYRQHIPTDMGFVAILEILMPTIEKSRVSIKQEMKDDNIYAMHVDNKYVTQDSYTYGLKFHNPFASVWQGIARSISVEEKLPVYLDVLVNSKESTLKAIWKRHEDNVDNVIGVRSYVTTHVYVRDYLKKNILQTVNPNLHNFVEVAHDDRYKHNVTIDDHDDYITRYNYKLSVFDDENPKYYQHFPQFSDFLVREGSLSEKLLKFLNYRRYIHLQHDVVKRGIAFRMEPMSHDVTAMEMTLKLDCALLDHTEFIQEPAMKVDARTTVVVKNKEQPVKTYDAIATLNLNSGHTVNSLKLDMTRIIPGQKDFKICVQGTETYTDHDLTGDMKVLMSQTEDGKCKSDETVIHMTLKAEQLHEQMQDINNYEACHRPVQDLITDLSHYRCYADRLSLRNYTVDVKYVHLPNEYKKIVKSYFKTLIAMHHHHYDHDEEVTEGISEDSLKIQMRYPISKDIVDVRIITPTDIYKFKGIPAEDLARDGIYPDNLYYGNLQHISHMMGLTDVYVIHKDELDDKFALLMGHSDKGYGVHGKLHNEKIVLKVVIPKHTIVITPVGDEYTVTLDDKDIDFKRSHRHKYFSLSRLEDSHMMVYYGRYTGTQIIFNGEEIVIESPKTDMPVEGKCAHKTL